MAEEFEITILTDKTSWMNKYNQELSEKLQELGHCVSLINCKNKLRKGDIAFFLSCFEIISYDKLQLHQNNIVVHASKLPQGKGWSPMSWQILEGKNIIPLTLFEASEKVDAGNIYHQDEMVLTGTELINDWQELLGRKIVEMCILYVKNYKNIQPIKQIGEESFYAKRTQKDSELDINQTIKDQFNLLRIVDNEHYPAFFEINGQKYKLRVEKYD